MQILTKKQTISEVKMERNASEYENPETGELDWLAMARDEGCCACNLCGYCVGSECPHWRLCSCDGTHTPDPT